MSKNEEINLQEGLKGDRGTETKTLAALSTEGEILCIIVHPDKKHVEGINHILNPLNELLPEKGFKPIYLSDETKPLEHHGKTFEQLAEDCALGIVILDGLRPNVLLEFGILMGKNKPIIPIQDGKACVAIKSFYQQNWQESCLTEKQFSQFLKDLKEPPLGFFSHISDLQGLKVEVVDKDASLSDDKYPKNVIEKAIEKLMPRIVEEYNKLSLKPVGKISLDYLERFHTLALEVAQYYGGMVGFSGEDVENAVEGIKNLEKESGTKMPSQVYSTIASLYISLAEKAEWRKIHEIVDYYNRSLEIYEGILQSESDPAVQSEARKKSGDIYCELSEYQDKAENCKRAIKAYEEALKVYTLGRFPIQYGTTQNNLGYVYKKLADVEAKANNCKKAITAFKEALKVRTLERFPIDYAMTQNGLGTAYGTLAEVEDKSKNCKKAITAFKEALKVYTLERFPIGYAATQNNLGNTYAIVAGAEAKVQNCKKAITAFKEALKVYTLERFPLDYASIHNNLGNAYRKLAEVEARVDNCKKAITAFKEALKVRTLERFPMDYAMTQNNLGNAYMILAQVEEKEDNYNRAIKAYAEALKIYTKEEFPELHKSVAHNLEILRAFYRGL